MLLKQTIPIEGFDESERLLMVGKTLLDEFLDPVGRMIQKLTRRPHPISFWVCAAVICLLILLISSVISIFLHEFDAIQREVATIEIVGTTLAFASLIIFKLFIQHIFSTLRENILEFINSETNLADLRRWVGLLCNVKLHLIFSLIYGLILGIYTANALSFAHNGFIGYGPSVTCCLVGFIWGMPMYFLLIFLLLPIRISQYDLRLFRPDPSSSEVVTHLSGLFATLVFQYAIVATGSMIFLAFARLFPTNGMIIISILVAWLPITLLFIIGQYAIAKIIMRGKWQMLNEIQAQVEQILSVGDLKEKETVENLNRLMDYHNRIKATNNTKLDLRAGLNFLNALLLPAVGVVLGNLDALKDIFSTFFN